MDLSDKLKPELFQPKDVIMKQGDIGDFLMILYKGAVEIQVGGEVMARIGKNSLLGEAALKTRERRTADVVATVTKLHGSNRIGFVKALLLYKKDYELALNEYMAEKLRQNQNLIRSMDIFKEWNLIKTIAFAESLTEI